MATFPIEFPTREVSTQRLVLNRRQSATESPFTYAVQVVNTASQWQLQWTWPRVTHANAEQLEAWLLSLRGQEGTFRYYPRQSVTSALTGKTLAFAGYAYNDTISVGGWAASQASTLRTGQFFSIGNQLLKITSAGANANTDGDVTISFEPELRLTYNAGTAVNFATPSGLFRLISSDGTGYTLDPDHVCDFGTLQAKEVVA